MTIDAFGLDGLLAADGPHPECSDGLTTFGRFVGRWSMRVRFFDESGATSFDGPGSWSFSWVLDGRAIQDVLVYDDPDVHPAPPGHRRIGTSLRSWNPITDEWTVTWLGATSGIHIHLRGGPVDGRIELYGDDVDGSRLRWTFSEITDQSFEWTGEIRSGDGPWRVEQRMTAGRDAT